MPRDSLTVLRTHKKGQAFIEYILFLVMVAFVIFGVMRPIIGQKMDEIQEQIRVSASAVISQTQLGIPLGWFFSNSGGDFGSVGQAIDGAGNPVGGGGGGGGDTPTGGDGPGSGPGVGNGTPSAGGGGPNTAAGNSANIRSSSAKNNRGSSDSGTSDDSPDNEEAKNSDKRSGRAGSGGADQGFGADNNEDDQPESTDLATTGEEAAEVSDSASGKTVKARDKEKTSVRGRRGCGDVNIFTILKIAAILVIILIAAAVAVSGRGNKGSD